MECFEGYIGIKGCGSQEPASGMFINQLPGITLESIEKIADKEQVTFLGVWKDVEARSIRKIRKDFLRLFKSRYVGYCCSCAECEPESIACANKELFIDAMMYCEGVEYMIERLYSSRRNSYTTVDKEQAKELKDFYQVEYEKSMEYAVSNIPKETIENCFDCTGKISRVESLP